jgi:hypothetical protein
MRTVAFIDILGFSDLVSRSTQDIEFLGKLHQALARRSGPCSGSPGR